MGNSSSAGSAASSRFHAECPTVPPAPSDAEVCSQFDEFLQANHVSAAVLEELSLTESTETKWMYICLSKFLVTPEAAEKELLDPRACIQEMLDMQPQNESGAHDLFRAVRINTILRAKDWIDKLVAADGLSALIGLLEPSRSLPVSVLGEVISVLFALCHCDHGISNLLQHDTCCKRLVALFASSSSSALKVRLLKFLGVFCCHNQAAQGAVVRAIEEQSGSEDSRYALLAMSFMQSDEDTPLQLAVLRLINAVINTTLTSAERVSIRDDLEKSGFVTHLKSYRTNDDGHIVPGLLMQVQMFLESDTNDRAKTVAPSGIQRRLSLRIPSASDEEPHSSVETAVRVEEPAAVAGRDSEPESQERTETLPTPQPDGPRSLQTRKSLKLEISELHTETDEVTPIVSPPPAPEPIQRRPSGSLLPSLSIPKIGVEFVAPKSVMTEAPPPQLAAVVVSTPSPPSLESIVSMLQQGTKNLDMETNQKLLHVLASLASSLTTDGPTCGVKNVVHKLEQSLVGGASAEAPDRISLKLPTRFTDADSLATPTKLATNPYSRFHTETAAVGVAPHSPIAGAELDVPRSPAHSHTEEEHSPRRSMTETESCDESFHEHEAATRAKSSTSSAKLALAGFFQHLKKGQGLPTTPAPTPMATASVKKDARRPVFPSFACGSAAPSPMPHHSSTGHFGSLPPLTPLKPSLSLPPLTPVRPQVMASPSTPTPIAMLKSPRANEDHLESVIEEEENAGAEQSSKTQAIPDISKFRKLLSMGAPKAAVRAKMQQAGVDPDLLDRPEPPQEAALPISVVPCPEPQSAVDVNPSGPDVRKFRKLLTMGAPMAAVKAKMVQAGLDPSLLDQEHAAPPKPATAVPPPSQIAGATSSTTVPGDVVDDPAAKFQKLLSMGAPLEAVKARMRQTGVDPALLDSKPSDSKLEAALGFSTNASSTKIKDDAEYAKFFKLRSMGAPAEAVKAKMRQAGLNPDYLDTPDAEVPSVKGPECPSNESSTTPVSVRVKDDPEYAKFFKLQSMKAPAAAVKAKMVQAGLNPALLDTPDAVLPPKGSNNSGNNNNADHGSLAPKMLVKDDPEYAKFFKLKTMAPLEVVKAKMRQAGLNPDLLDTPDADMPPKGGDVAGVAPPPAPAKLNAGSALASMFAKRQGSDSAVSSNQPAPVVLVKDDPAYAKFFKLVAMGAPPDTVKGKMQMAGLKPELLDTPDAPLNPPAGSGNQATNNSGTGAPTRRANLTLSIKPPTSVAKPTTRPFYWQHMKGDSIRGTIWEEIENDHAKDNNQLPVFLADTELVQLESEFPAQTAPMTGPNKQTRSLSMDQMPKELMSPRVVFLIDRSRANNISIIIKQFRMSHAAIREAIMKVDANVLNIERVQGLIKILPTDEEVASIMGYQGDPLMLNEAERVLKELISVPRLKQRLMAMQSKLQFPTFVRDLQQKVEKLRCASTEVAQSVEFKMILLVVLQVGNRMNQGTARGGAKGFRLGDLTKLAQLKSADKTTTLLHYVARMIRQKKGNAVRLSESLSSLYDVQNIPTPELPGDMSKISEIVDYISNELGAQKLKNAIEEKEACDHFVKVMSEFLDTASATTKCLKDELDAVMKLLKDTMQRFGFQGESESSDETSSPPTGEAASAGANHATLTSAGEFFLTIYEFSVALTKADRENEVKRLREEARAKQSQKAKTPALGPRSMSSRDVLRKQSEKKTAEDISATGPETPEPSKAKGDKPTSGIPGPRVSPMLRQRSASLSAIVENNADIATVLSKSPGQASIAKPAGSAEKQSSITEKKAAAQEREESKSKATTPSKKPETPETKPSAIKPPTKIAKPNSIDKAKGAPSSTKAIPKPVLTVPGKIVKTTTAKPASPSTSEPQVPQNLDFSVDYDSPLGLTMPLSLEKPKSKPKPEFEEEVTPFDMASIEEIRAQLAKKHVVCEGNNNSELQSAS